MIKQMTRYKYVFAYTKRREAEFKDLETGQNIRISLDQIEHFFPCIRVGDVGYFTTINGRSKFIIEADTYEEAEEGREDPQESNKDDVERGNAQIQSILQDTGTMDE